MNPPIKLQPDDERAYSYSIGGVFINFGALEMMSFRWVDTLGRDPVVMRDLAIDMNLARRIELIVALITRSDWPDDLKQKSISLWREVSDQSKIRNTIAHNPFVTAKNREGLTVSGIANAKKMKGEGPYEYELLSAEDISKAALRAGALGRELATILINQRKENGA